MTQQEAKRLLVRPITIAAAIVGMVQGVVWFLLALFSILVYREQITGVGDVTEGGTDIGHTIYSRYLYKDFTSQLDIKVTPNVFFIFMNFYVILGFVWFVVSSTLLWAMLREKWRHWNRISAVWSCLAILMSVLDVILMSLVAYDYNLLNGKLASNRGVVLAAVGIVMTLAAKGYIVLIMNVVFAVVLGKFCYDQSRESDGPQRSVIDAYATSQSPWDVTNNSLYDEANAANFEFTNKTYRDDKGFPIFSSSRSFTRLDLEDNDGNVNPLTNRNTQDRPVINQVQMNGQNILDSSQFILGPQNDTTPNGSLPGGRTAKIGRQPSPSRTPPLNVPPPFIPENGDAPYIPPPDYTPPGSPKIKSVLRPRSNYVL